MPTVTQRSAIRAGDGALQITLPKAWVDYYRVKPRDKLRVVADGVLTVHPPETSPGEVKVMRPGMVGSRRQLNVRVELRPVVKRSPSWQRLWEMLLVPLPRRPPDADNKEALMLEPPEPPDQTQAL